MCGLFVSIAHTANLHVELVFHVGVSRQPGHLALKNLLRSVPVEADFHQQFDLAWRRRNDGVLFNIVKVVLEVFVSRKRAAAGSVSGNTTI